eukprot:gene16107-biopygen14308
MRRGERAAPGARAAVASPAPAAAAAAAAVAAAAAAAAAGGELRDAGDSAVPGPLEPPQWRGGVAANDCPARANGCPAELEGILTVRRQMRNFGFRRCPARRQSEKREEERATQYYREQSHAWCGTLHRTQLRDTGTGTTVHRRQSGRGPDAGGAVSPCAGRGGYPVDCCSHQSMAAPGNANSALVHVLGSE